MAIIKNEVKLRSSQDLSKCLASLALFRELYNNQNDIYGVISEFLDDIITSKGKYDFDLTEITTLLNDTFEFTIPEAVVRTSLKKLSYLKKEYGKYCVTNEEVTKNSKVNNLQKEIQVDNNNTLQSLFSFIEFDKKIKLSAGEKEQIIHSFCSFILDDTTGEDYFAYISAFILKNKGDQTFTNNLNKIREGVILYSGIKYTNNASEVGSWKTQLTIYLDMEILFHFAGYNGLLYKSLFDDFFRYVNEINNNAQKRIIKLKYFREVKSEIEKFFTTATYVIEGKGKQGPKRSAAMSAIVEGCKSPSDIIDRKSDFYVFLKNNHIYEDDEIYYEENSHEYNIIDKNTIELISEEYGFDVSKYLNFLNYIHINRKKTNKNNFDNISHILLTGNSKSIKLAWHNRIKPEGTVPLATTLDWITNKFWFKLNKGFGDGAFPRSFNIITRAQIILSSILDESIFEKYHELQLKVKEGELTEEQVRARVVNLRSQVRRPEDIETENVDSILESVTSNDSLEQFIEEHEKFKNRALQYQEENESLKHQMNVLQQISEDNRELENLEHKKLLLIEKNGRLNLLLDQKTTIDKVINRDILIFKIKIGGVYLIYFGLCIFVIIKIDWSIIEPILFLIGIAFAPVYSLIYEKDWNPIHYLQKKKDFYRKKNYKNFNINHLNELELEIESLEKDISDKKNNKVIFRARTFLNITKDRNPTL